MKSFFKYTSTLLFFLMNCYFVSLYSQDKNINKNKTFEQKKEVNFSELPRVNREFRAAWIATVANINWPTKNNLSTEQQKNEAISILNILQKANFNAVIFQARPSSDAFYKSDLEPWSYFLSGETGKAPTPYYDPLEFWITEAHKRGMELHVWLNPYRAHHSNGGSVSGNSMAKKMASSTHKLRNGMYWMDPSDPKVQSHVSNVIQDLVKRYEIDAVHIDDYFYPYREYNGGKDFPDDKTWKEYQYNNGTLSKADWRRENVNQFIQNIQKVVKSQKPDVLFGISPFGIWKPGFPEGVTGTSQYDDLYADAKLWLNEGWCDYFAPQLYWRDGGAQSFSSLLNWWESENKKNIHLWAGLNTIGIKGVPDKVQEIKKQIEITRTLTTAKNGAIHYSVDGITKNSSMMAMLQDTYKEKALVPESPWIKIKKLPKPNVMFSRNAEYIPTRWSVTDENKVLNWILYTRYGNTWSYEILDQQTLQKNIPIYLNKQKISAIALAAVDRIGNIGDIESILF